MRYSCNMFLQAYGRNNLPNYSSLHTIRNCSDWKVINWYQLTVKNLCCVLLFGITVFLQAETNPATESKLDSSEVNRLLYLSDTSQDYTQKIIYAQDALSKSKSIKWTKGIGKSYLQLCKTDLLEEKYRQSIIYGNEALKYFIQIKDNYLIIETYYEIGHAYDYLGDCPQTLDYYSLGFNLSESIQNHNGKIDGYLFLSETFYYYLKDYDMIIEFSGKALGMAKEIGDKEKEAYAEFNLCLAYIGKGDFSKANEMNEKALAYYISVNDYSSISQSYSNLGTIRRKGGNGEKALEADLTAMEYFKKVDFNNYFSGTLHLNLANDYLLLAKSKGNNISLLKAREYFHISLEKLKNIHDRYDVANAYKGLSEVEELSGNFKAAYQWKQRYLNLHDSVYSAENGNKRAYLEKVKNEELNRKNKLMHAMEITISNNEILKQKQIRNIVISLAMLITLVLIIAIYQRNRFLKEKVRSEELLLNILPAEVAEELKSKGYADAKEFESATVLFTDFKHFTQLSEKMSAQELVNEINYYYSAFDRIIGKYGIEKIKTIGDSYMCAGGLPIAKPEIVGDVVRAALEIRNFVQQEIDKKVSVGLPFLEIRIGIHSGPLIAGIVGVTKFQYDIWGDTVNTASRMESSGEPGKVNISGTTYELIKNNFDCTYRGKVVAKGKGEIEMYFVDAEIM